MTSTLKKRKTIINLKKGIKIRLNGSASKNAEPACSAHRARVSEGADRAHGDEGLIVTGFSDQNLEKWLSISRKGHVAHARAEQLNAATSKFFAQLGHQDVLITSSKLQAEVKRQTDEVTEWPCTTYVARFS